VTTGDVPAVGLWQARLMGCRAAAGMAALDDADGLDFNFELVRGAVCSVPLFVLNCCFAS